MVFSTRKDFSFLGAILGWCGVVALLLIVSGAIFGFELGTFFSVAMIALAGGAILHDTSKVLHHFPEDRYVAAVARALRLGGAHVLVRPAPLPVAEGLTPRGARGGGMPPLCSVPPV